MKSLYYTVCAAYLALPGTCYCEDDPPRASIAERKAAESIESRLREDAEIAGKSCEMPLTASFEWEGFRGSDWQERRELISNLCGDTLSAIRDVCAEGTGKEAVRSRISSYVCSAGDGSAPQLSVEEGRLVLKLDLKAKNYYAYAKSWLESNL